jgi:hypothetical protein
MPWRGIDNEELALSFNAFVDALKDKCREGLSSAVFDYIEGTVDSELSNWLEDNNVGGVDKRGLKNDLSWAILDAVFLELTDKVDMGALSRHILKFEREDG